LRSYFDIFARKYGLTASGEQQKPVLKSKFMIINHSKQNKL